MKRSVVLLLVLGMICILLLAFCPVRFSPYSNTLSKRYPQTEFRYGTAHFVYGLWDKGEVPEKFRKNMNVWSDKGWDIKLWDKDMVYALLDKYPRYKEVLPLLSRKVQLADLSRLLILYDEGGHYFDLDCVPKEGDLLSHLREYNPPEVFYQEIILSPLQYLYSMTRTIRDGKPESSVRISNFAFGAHPGNRIILQNLENLRERCILFRDYNTDYDVLYKTGPDCTTLTIDQNPDTVVLIPTMFLKHIPNSSWRDNKDH